MTHFEWAQGSFQARKHSASHPDMRSLQYLHIRCIWRRWCREREPKVFNSQGPWPAIFRWCFRVKVLCHYTSLCSFYLTSASITHLGCFLISKITRFKCSLQITYISFQIKDVLVYFSAGFCCWENSHGWNSEETTNSSQVCGYKRAHFNSSFSYLLPIIDALS